MAFRLLHENQYLGFYSPLIIQSKQRGRRTGHAAADWNIVGKPTAASWRDLRLLAPLVLEDDDNDHHHPYSIITGHWGRPEGLTISIPIWPRGPSVGDWSTRRWLLSRNVRAKTCGRRVYSNSGTRNVCAELIIIIILMDWISLEFDMSNKFDCNDLLPQFRMQCKWRSN